MLELNGNNLGSKQHELNGKVREAFKHKVNFDEIKVRVEKSDVDRLFKIDLASLYNNIDYIIEILKCGDSLYITRALKCIWIYKIQFKHVINPDYLHQHVFSLMSTKMRKKALAAIAKNITDPELAQDFYQYCLRIELDHIAIDFLIKAQDSFKFEYLNKHAAMELNCHFEHFFGNSIDLIECFLQKKKAAVNNVDQDIYKLRYLFSFSPEIYLNILEKYTDPPSPYSNSQHHDKFGLRMSKEIMVKHKSRVLGKLWLYLRKLNIKVIARHSTIEDAKKYIISMLPAVVNDFWNMNYYNKYIDFFNLLPETERYQFLKQIFNDKYPDDIFEMDVQFYYSEYYKLLTVDEKNDWALKHLEQKQELLGPDKDFCWYSFIKFDKAFSDIKKLIMKTTCPSKRASLLEVLIKSAKSCQDCEMLMSYYVERHINEIKAYKEDFVDQIIKHHDIYQFSEKFWESFNKISYSIIIESTRNLNEYTIPVIFYYILHNKKHPEILESYCECRWELYVLKMFLNKMNKEQQELIYQFFEKLYVNEIEKLLGCTGDEKQNGEEKAKAHVRNVLIFVEALNKSKADCHEVIINFVMSHSKEFSYNKWFKREIFTDAKLLQLLKKDKLLLVNKLQQIKDYPLDYRYLNIKNVLCKLKIYFSNDINESVIAFFEGWLYSKDTEKLYNHIIFALFQLADEKYMINFLVKYVPVQPKIEHDKINEEFLKIQKAICRFAYYSRPPVPLDNMLQYVKGDYVHFCLPMFNSYLVNLPLPLSLKFIEWTLNSPVSIQKHGLRLAFLSYNPDTLNQLIQVIWKKIKNVSLREVIYKLLFKKVKKANEEVQTQLYEALKIITLDLNEDDSDNLFNLLVSGSLPGTFNGDYLQAAWTTVHKLPDSNFKNVNRKIQVIKIIATHIEQMDREFCRTEIIDAHIQNQLLQKKIFKNNNKYGNNGLIEAKWNLTAKYITHFDNDEQLNDCSKLLELVMVKCEAIRNSDKKDTIESFLFSFVQILMDQTDYRKDMVCKSYIVPIYEKIIEIFVSTWSLKQIYPIVLRLKLLILGRTTVSVGEFNIDKQAITYDHLSVNEVSNNFARGIADILHKLLATEQFYYSFYPDIANLISETIQEMTSWTNLDCDTLRISVCCALTKINLKEGCILAAHMLPVEVNDKKDAAAHSSVIHVLKEFDNDEVKTFTYHKFIRRNFFVTL